MKDKPVILVVDDQPQNIELLEAYLVPQGYEIVKAANGEEALGKLSDNQIDLILLDVMMPGMDGFEVTRRVRQDHSHRLLPIILVTVLRETEDRVKGIEAGCDDFISHPVDKMELLARVRSLLKVKAYNDLMSNYRKELESEVTRRTEELKHAFIFQQRLIDALPVPVFYKDSEGRYLGCNSSFEEFFGQKREQVTGKSVYELSPKEFADIYHEKDLALLQNPGIQIYESTVKDTGGVVHDVIFHKATFPNMDGSVGGLIGAILDITDLKRVEERYRSIFENAQEGIFRSTVEGKIIMANPAMATIFGYTTPEELMTSVTNITRQLYVHPEERAKVSKIIEEQSYVKNYETQNYRKDGSIIWISLTMHAVRDEKGQIMYYDGIIEDITNRKQRVERIRKALGATVQAIAVTVETRDPYTAGHQRRVSDLARAIATEMNLPIDRIDGIRMAAAIHDLGKISVPAEILSRPTKLTNIEFSLIKTHSQSGYDILKDIDFPWPIARTVLEHHERMNGSGYPNGLTGDNLLMESRILSVADVVESMASHRPYRSALGIDAALNEISKNKRVLYDPEVSDACLRLFHEKDYKIID
jgi:PAS domain S-box-containing protein